MTNDDGAATVQGEALAVLLRRAAREAALLGDLVRPVEATVTDGMTSGRIAPDRRAALQAVDLLSQSAAALAAYLDRLAEATPTDCAAPDGAALDAVPLEAMRTRLAGLTGRAGAEAASREDDTGAVALF